MQIAVEEQLSPATPTAGSPRSRGLLRIVFSFPVVRIALLTVLTVLTVRSRFSDSDLWWHLKTGEIIWKTHAIPRVDLFSFTTNQHAYTPHEWLAQLSIYAAYFLGGYSGIMLWLCVFASLIPITGYALCWSYSGNRKIAFLGALGIWLFATVGFSARPQLAGYLCLLCELLIVCLGRSKSPKWFMALPVLFVIWVNLHGSFFLGFIALAIIMCCACIDFRLGLLESQRWTTRERKMLAAAIALSFAALFVNPVGLSQVTYPINTLFSQPIGLQSSIEWQPAPMNDIRLWAMFGSAALVLTLPLLTRAVLRLEELLLLGVGFVLAVQHHRMFFVFGILVMPSLCRMLAAAWNQNKADRDSVLVHMVMLGFAVIPIVLGFPNSRDLADQVKKANPVKAVQFIRDSGLSGRMLNQYVYGGYLIWAVPEHKVFIDGRADVYEWTDVFGDYMDWTNIKTAPGFLLDKHHIDFCVLSREEAITRVLPLLPGWKTVYSDEMSIIFARSDSGQKYPSSTP